VARVLLVSANQERSPDPVAPLGVCYVATATAAAGHTVTVLDLCFEPDVEAAVGDAVADARPDVVGIALRNVDNCAYPDTVSYLPHYRRVVAACRAATGAPIVLGGPAFTTMPGYYLARLDVAAGVVGEGEVAFPAVAERLAAGRSLAGVGGAAVRTPSGTVAVTPPAWLPTLDDLTADRCWIDHRRYYAEGGMANLQTKRGCHFKCTYCAYPIVEGRGMRTRDPATIHAEVARLLDDGIEQFFVVDSIFNSPRGYAEAVADALAPLGEYVRWSCFVAPGNFTEALCERMQAAGCQSVDFGTDAGAAETLHAFRKHFSVDDVRTASRICRERHLPFCHSLIFGGQGETWDTVRATVDLMDECAPVAVNAMCGVRVYPGTPLATSLLASGDVPGEDALHEPWFYVAPAVRDGLAEHVADVARERGNWILPGRRVNDEAAVHDALRGRGLKGDLWRYLARLRVGTAIPAAARR
jgi:radical SAM superfamily enzyme YgiQ (UPF0313 family)